MIPKSNGSIHSFPNSNSHSTVRAVLEDIPPENLSGLRLLVVDEDESSRRRCTLLAETLQLTVGTANSIRTAQRVLGSQSIDVLLLDLGSPEEIGLFFLEEVRARYPETVIVVMSSSPTMDSVLRVFRLGAADHLGKPFSVEEFTAVLEHAAQRRTFDAQSRALRERLRSGTATGSLVGRSPAMEKLYRILSKVAFTTHPVLILGESGTGKELVARSIHLNGPNAGKPFVAVDCGALVPTLIESELFGHVKGAFTGALRDKPGLLAVADGGTVFLDEIGELPLDLQAKLLRALQEKEIRPVGSTHAVPISARVLTATNRDLAAMVESGRFRKDLYYRLNVVNIRIPPLRDRRSDILPLAEYFLERLRRDSGLPYTLAHDALRVLTEYDWPGNVRELEHAVEHACALSSGPVLHVTDLPSQMQDPRFRVASLQATAPEMEDIEKPFAVTPIADMEKQAILRTIEQLNGDKLMAARLLGIGKTTLYRKLKEYGIDPTTGR